MTRLGEMVRTWMEGQRFPVHQAELARDIGEQEGTVSRWLNGHKEPLKPEVIQKLSDATGLDYTRLFLADAADCGYAVNPDD